MTITSGGKIYSVKPIDGAIDTNRTFAFAMDGNNCTPYYTDEMQDITQFLRDAGIYKGEVLPEAKFTILEGENSWFSVGKGEYYNAGVVIHGEMDKLSIDAGIGVKGEIVSEHLIPKELKIPAVGGDLKISFQTPTDILDIAKVFDLSKFTLIDTFVKQAKLTWDQATKTVISYFSSENSTQVTNQFNFDVDPSAAFSRPDITDPNYWNGSLVNGAGYNASANFEVNTDVFDANGHLNNWVNDMMAGTITDNYRPGNGNTAQGKGTGTMSQLVDQIVHDPQYGGYVNSFEQGVNKFEYIDPLISTRMRAWD